MTNLIQLRQQPVMLTIMQPVIFDQQKSPSYKRKEKVQEKNQDIANAEVQVLQSIGKKLGQKQTPDFKDENECLVS